MVSKEPSAESKEPSAQSTEPSKVLTHCPRCGSAHFSARSKTSFECGDCSFVFFCNIASGTAGLIINSKGELLVTLRADDPKKGMYDLPGGFIDTGETAEEALAREIKEELDLDASDFCYFTSRPNTYEYKGLTYYVIDLAFTCQVNEEQEMKLSDEITSCRFMPFDEIPPEKIAFDSIRYFIEKYKESFKKSPSNPG